MGGIAEMLYTGENRPRLGNAVYGLFGRDFTTRDGQRTMIVVVTPRQWANLIAALNLGEAVAAVEAARDVSFRSEEHTSELQSLMRNSYAVFCLKKKTNKEEQSTTKK